MRRRISTARWTARASSCAAMPSPAFSSCSSICSAAPSSAPRSTACRSRTPGRTYALLTIGDGLVAQIPALLLSVAVAILVTRVSKPHDMSQQIMSQVLGQPRALAVTAGILDAARHHSGHAQSRVPDHGGGVRRRRLQPEQRGAPRRRPRPRRRRSRRRLPTEQRELSWDDVEPVDALGLEVGYRLIPLVDRAQGGELMGRIKGVRKKLSEELGFLVQPVHIRDNLELGPNSYRITILGAPVGESEVFPDRELAINPGQVSGTLPGSATKDPAFGLDAVWIEKSRRDQAQAQGYTVVDASSVIATHLSHLLQSHAHELLGPRGSAAAAQPSGQDRAEADRGSGAEAPADERGRQGAAATCCWSGCRSAICAPSARRSRSSRRRLRTRSALVAAVRVALGRSIVQNIGGLREELPVITLDPALEQVLQDSMSRRRRFAGIRARPRRQDSTDARGQHAPAGGRRRARGAAWSRRRFVPGSRG